MSNEFENQAAPEGGHEPLGEFRELKSVFRKLAEMCVARIEVRYDGYGDSGAVERVEAFDADGKPTEPLPPEVHGLIEEVALETLGDGWDNNEGSFGTFVIDLKEWKVRQEHTERGETFYSNEECDL